jgi:competence protein ComGC
MKPRGDIPFQQKAKFHKLTGFSLVEMAIVLFIATLLLTIGVAMFTNIAVSTRLRTSNTNADAIKIALVSYIARNNRLPCPAIATLAPGAAGYGVEDATAGCTNTAVGTEPMARGVIPWVSLGLPADVVTDGWGRAFTFHVTIAATQLTAATLPGMMGSMTLHTATPTALGLTPTGNQLNSCMNTVTPPAGGDDANGCNLRAAVVLISHGENGLGGYTLAGQQMPLPFSNAEIENTDNDIAFVNAEATAGGANQYDDLVFAFAPDELLFSLAQQGAIKNARAVTAETIRATQESIVSNIVNSATGSSAPVPAAAAMPNDAWGHPLIYVRNSTDACTSNLTPVFTIRSVGVDNVDSTGGPNANTNRDDDILISQPRSQIAILMLNRGFSCVP